MNETEEEKEYNKLLNEIPEVEEEEESNYDNLSQVYCSSCGKRMLIAEYEEFEDTCGDCIWEDTSGIIDDDYEKELNFDN